MNARLLTLLRLSISLCLTESAIDPMSHPMAMFMILLNGLMYVGVWYDIF